MVDFRIVAGLDTNNVTAGLGAIEKRFKSLTGSISALAGSFGIAFGVRAIIDQLDAYKNLQNRLKSVTDASVSLAEINNTLLGISNRSGASIAATTQIYSRLATSQKTLGISTAQLTDFTETLSKTIAISGATSYEAQGSLIQFSQAMASGALRGDELRAVMEQLPEVSNVIAKQFGVTTGQLAILGKQGKITSEQILIAFSKAAPEIEARFQRTAFTISNSFVILKNNILTVLGELDRSTGASKAVSDSIIFLAKNIDTAVIAAKNLAFILGPSVLVRTIQTLTVVMRANPFLTIASAISVILALVPELQTQVEDLIARMLDFYAKVSGVEVSLQSFKDTATSVFKTISMAMAKSVDLAINLFNGFFNAFILEGYKTADEIYYALVYYFQLAFKTIVDYGVTVFLTLYRTVEKIFKSLLDSLKYAAQAVVAAVLLDFDEAEARGKMALDALTPKKNIFDTVGDTFAEELKEVQAAKIIDPAKWNDEAKGIGTQFVDSFLLGFNASGDKITRAVSDTIYGTFKVPFRIGALDEPKFNLLDQFPTPGSGVLREDVYQQMEDERARRNRQQAAFAPRGAMGLIPENFKSPGGAAGAGKADEYAKEIEQLQKALALDYERINTSQQAADFLSKRLELEAQGIELSGEQLAMLQNLTASAADYAAAAQFAQQLDVTKQLIDQERQLNLLLAERPDLGRSIEDAMLSSKIAALETSTTLEAGFTRAFLKLKQEAQNLAAVGEQVVNVFADKMTEALTTFLQTGEFNFKKFASSILDEITKILVRMLIVQAISAAVGGGAAGPAAASLATAIGGGGARAKGGTVQPDRSYLVGEQGPEIFQPRTTGSIVPNPASVEAAPPQVNVQVVNVDDPNAVPAAINKGGSDEAILNVLARNRDRVKQTIG